MTIFVIIGEYTVLLKLSIIWNSKSLLIEKEEDPLLQIKAVVIMISNVILIKLVIGYS